MNDKQRRIAGQEPHEHLAALISNANAVRAMAEAVESTLGPKGLDTMLVDRQGEVVVTNDGITILTRMNASHPAARMVTSVARAQEREVGDGTTTATVLAAALLDRAVTEAQRGVPVTRLIEGIRLGLERAAESIAELARPVTGQDDPLLAQVALVAGRGDAEVARLVVAAARLWGEKRLKDPAFRLGDSVLAETGAESEVLAGVVIRRPRLDLQQPVRLSGARILVLDDALEPEPVLEGALTTEAGFRQYRENRAAFVRQLDQLLELGVNVVVVDRSVDDEAAQRLTDAGVMVLQRVAMREWQRLAEHIGARVIRRAALAGGPEALQRAVGRARKVEADERLHLTRITGGHGRPMATVLVGAATDEVAAERERIARDAAAAVQAAVRGGVVPGGGAVEVAAARAVTMLQGEVPGMSGYGVACVAEALKEPFARIMANAGFNPLEKLGCVWSAQSQGNHPSLAVDCDTGDLVDMWAAKVVDPAPVKLYALRAAGEIATAVLRIHAIVVMKDGADT